MRLNFAIIGCGRIAQRHAEQIKKIGILTAVCDINPTTLQDFASKFSAVPYSKIEDLLKNEPLIDVVCICTPNGLHADQSIKALQAKKHVLCEKPLSISKSDAEEMIKASQLSEKKLFVVKQNRYNPPVVFLKELVSLNKLGKIHSFQINCFWNRPPAYYTDWKGTKTLDGGTLYTQFSHFIDLLYWILGEVETVQSITKNYQHPFIEFEDTGVVLIKMKSGAIGTLNYTVNTYAQNMEGSFTVFGEKGTVKIGGQYLNELEYCQVEGIHKPNLPIGNPANGYGFYQGSMSNHDKVYENLVLAIQNPAHEIANGQDGLKTVEIIEKIYSPK